MTLSRRELFFALFFFALLTVIFTWPVVTHIRQEIPTSGQPVDPAHILYGLTSGARALAENPLDFFNATFLYPSPLSLAFLDQIFALCLMTAPLLRITGDMILSYNVTWLATFLFSGLGAYLLVRYLTRNRTASFLGGILYAFHPLRYHSAGILHVVGMMWIPFALLFLHMWVTEGSRRHLVLFAAFSLAQFLSSGYTGTFLILAVLLYFLVRFFVERKATLALLKRDRYAIVGTGLVSLLVLSPLIAPFINNAEHLAEDTHRSIGSSALFSAVPADFITPAPNSLLDAVAPAKEAARHPLFPGLIAVVLAMMWLAGRGWRDHRRRPEMIFYALLTLTGSLLALGPWLLVSETRIPMPFAAAYYVLPGAALIRAPVRFFVLASLGIAVLAGAELARRRGGPGFFRSRGMGTLLIAATAFELVAVPVALLNPLPHGVPAEYDRLIDDPTPAVIVDLPMPADEQGETLEYAFYQLYSLFHGRRLVNGVAAFVPAQTREIRRQMQEFPDGNSVQTLQDLGVTWAFVHTELYPREDLPALRERLAAHPSLGPLEAVAGVWVTRIGPER